MDGRLLLLLILLLLLLLISPVHRKQHPFAQSSCRLGLRGGLRLRILRAFSTRSSVDIVDKASDKASDEGRARVRSNCPNSTRAFSTRN